MMVIRRPMWNTEVVLSADLPLEVVRQLADGVPVTKEMIVALNPKRSEWDEIKAELDEIGYLNKL